MEKRDELIDLLPKEDIDRLFKYEYNQFDCSFLGFTKQYKALATIIPKAAIVIDFGCNAGCQSYYFREHKKYIGVEATYCEVINYPNTEYYFMTIQKFIKDVFPTLEINEKQCFAICNYVPDNEAQDLVKDSFTNVFNYYPQRYASDIVVKLSEKE